MLNYVLLGLAVYLITGLCGFFFGLIPGMKPWRRISAHWREEIRTRGLTSPVVVAVLPLAGGIIAAVAVRDIAGGTVRATHAMRIAWRDRPRDCAATIFDIVAIALPRKIANEEFGDAQEMIDRILNSDRPRTRLWLAWYIWWRCFWACANALRSLWPSRDKNAQ